MTYLTYQFTNNMFFKHQQQQLSMNSFQVHQTTTSSFIIFTKTHNTFIHMIFDT